MAEVTILEPPPGGIGRNPGMAKSSKKPYLSNLRHPHSALNTLTYYLLNRCGIKLSFNRAQATTPRIDRIEISPLIFASQVKT